MKKFGRIVVALALVLFASAMFGNVWEVDYHYYSDSTFTTQVGEVDILCDDSEQDWGTTSDFRVRDRTNCNDGQPAGHACQIYTDTQWSFVTCPPGV